MNLEPIRKAVTSFVLEFYAKNGLVPAVSRIIAGAQVSRYGFYHAFPGGIGEVAAGLSLPLPAERIEKITPVRTARSEADEARVELERKIFKRLERGETPGHIAAEIGNADFVDKCFKRWLDWRDQDYMKARSLLVHYGLLSRAGGPICSAINDIMFDLDDTKNQLNRSNETISELRDSIARQNSEIGREREDKLMRLIGMKLVYGHFVGKIGSDLLSFTKALGREPSNEELHGLSARFVRDTAQALLEARESLEINPQDPMFRYAGHAEMMRDLMNTRRRIDEIGRQVTETMSASG